MRGILEGIRYFFATSRAARIVLASVLGVSAVGAGGAGIYAIMNDNIEPEVVEEVQVDEEAGAEDVYIPEFKSVVLTSESLEKDLTIYISDKEDNAVTGVPFQVKLLKPETAETLQTYIDAIDGVNAQIAEMVSPEDDLTSVLENRNVDITITDENGEVVETQKGRIKDDPLYQLYLDKEEAIQSFAMAVKDAEGNVYTDEDEDGVIAEKDMEPGDYVACLLYDFDNTEIYDPAEYATAVNVKNKVEYKVQKEITKQIKKDVAAEDAKPKAAPVENVLKDTVEYVESRRVENGAKAVAVAGGDVVAPKSTAKSSTYKKKGDSRTTVEHALKKDVEKFKITINYELLDKDAKVVATVPVEKDKEYAKGAKIEHKAPDEYKYNEKTYVKKSGPEPAFEATVTKAATYKFTYQIKAEATPTPTPTEKPSATPTPSPTPTEKPSTSPTPKEEATPTPTPTPEATPTPTPTPTPEATPTSTEDAAKARGVKRPLAVSFNANRLNTMLFATRVKRIAANDNSIEKVTLDMSYKEGVFTITATGSGKSEIVDVKVNGTAVTMKDGKGTFTATGDGDYKLTGTPKWSDGVGATDKEALYVVYTVSGFGTASGERLKDKAGNELFLDEGLSKPATAADYNKDKTYYYKSATYTYYGWQSIDGATYYFDKNANKVTGEQVIQGVKYNFGPDGALLVKGNGIDVSKYQGKIDWNQAKSAVSFAIIRCGYRGQTDGQLHEDPYFYQNMKGAKAAGVATGIYIFSRAVNEAEAVQEASMAVAMANKAGGCAYPIFIDMEDTARGGGLSGAQRTAIANAFIATVQSSGYKAGVYCSKNWMLQRMEAGGINGSAYIWIAQYNTSCTYSGKYSIWQYSSSGSVPGIKGRVDMNKSFF